MHNIKHQFFFGSFTLITGCSYGTVYDYLYDVTLPVLFYVLLLVYAFPLLLVYVLVDLLRILGFRVSFRKLIARTIPVPRHHDTLPNRPLGKRL